MPCAIVDGVKVIMVRLALYSVVCKVISHSCDANEYTANSKKGGGMKEERERGGKNKTFECDFHSQRSCQRGGVDKRKIGRLNK